MNGDTRIPILKLGHLLLVSIQVDLHDRMALALQEDLANKIAATGALGVLIDISALEFVDSFIGRMLADISGIGRVLDAETVVVGMRPVVAITLVGFFAFGTINYLIWGWWLQPLPIEDDSQPDPPQTDT